MLLIITGKTASGKDTICAKLLQKYPDFKKILTTTSRKPRPNEQNWQHYHFISKEEFKQKITNGDFVEYVEYGGNFYGTEKVQLDPNKNLIWKTDPSWAGKAKKILKNFDVLVIYVMVNNETVLQRLRSRKLSEEEIAKRMTDDHRFWANFQNQYDYIVQNIPGKLDLTISKIAQIIQSKV